MERPGGKGMRLWRHASESGHGTKPKPTLPGHRCCAGRKAEPKGEATEGPWGVGSLHSTPRSGKPITRGRGDNDTKPAKATRAGHCRTGARRDNLLRGIADKARHDKAHRFGNLYGELNEALLKEAWRGLNKSAASGIDRVMARDYEQELDANIEDLVERLKGKRYRARAVRRHYIPKGMASSARWVFRWWRTSCYRPGWP